MLHRRVCERYSSQCVVPTVKHGGGSLFVWCGVSQLYRCEGTMRQDQYIRGLRNHMLLSAASLYGAFLFQQDNSSCHEVNKVMALFERSDI